MNNPRAVFEAVMRANGHTNFAKQVNGRYKVPSLQTRWKYFMLGWEMRGAG
jgi:hypothetical protein